MQTDTAQQQGPVPPASDREMLGEARRRLVGIHMALAERTNAERQEIMPWTLEQLMKLIREIRAFEQDHPTDAG